jgi:hypothetical protein
MINIKCSCGEVYHADERFVGQTIKCRFCNSLLKVELPKEEPKRSSESFAAADVEPQTRNIPIEKRNVYSKYVPLLFIAGIAGIIYLLSLYNNHQNTLATPSESNNSSEPTNQNPPVSNNTPEPYVEAVKVVSPYKGNQLQNGTSPLNNCFNYVEYGGNVTLTIKNGSSSDAIICLYNVGKGRTVINEYVRKNTNHTINHIRQGNYKIRVLYGNDWNPTITNSCGTNGNFESDVSFSEFDSPEYFTDNETGYSTVTITLYTVANGNVSTSKIESNTFFGK